MRIVCAGAAYDAWGAQISASDTPRVSTSRCCAESDPAPTITASPISRHTPCVSIQSPAPSASVPAPIAFALRRCVSPRTHLRAPRYGGQALSEAPRTLCASLRTLRRSARSSAQPIS